MWDRIKTFSDCPRTQKNQGMGKARDLENRVLKPEKSHNDSCVAGPQQKHRANSPGLGRNQRSGENGVVGGKKEWDP